MLDAEVLRKQTKLQKEAYEVLDRLGIITYLSRFGKPEIVGSLAHGLMTWPDIDIILRKQINEDDFWKTAAFLLAQRDFKTISIMDFRKSVNPNTPKGLHICIKDFEWKGKGWKIDLWFIPPIDQSAENLNEWLKIAIKEQHKLPILKIKSEIFSHPKYRKEVFSIDIYRAVIEKGITDLEEFKKYLRETKRKLD